MMRTEDSENKDFIRKKSTCVRWREVKFQNSASKPVRCRVVVITGESIHVHWMGYEKAVVGGVVAVWAGR